MAQATGGGSAHSVELEKMVVCTKRITPAPFLTPHTNKPLYSLTQVSKENQRLGDGSARKAFANKHENGSFISRN